MNKTPLSPLSSPLALLSLILLTLLLSAHSQPTKISPAPGSTVRSPQEIRLVFAEPLSPNLTIELLPAGSFTPIPNIIAQQDPQNPAEVFATLPPLEAGTYTVQWQVESSDGHFVSGIFSFAVNNNLWASIPPWLIVLVVGFILILLVYLPRRQRRRPTPV